MLLHHITCASKKCNFIIHKRNTHENADFIMDTSSVWIYQSAATHQQTQRSDCMLVQFLLASQTMGSYCPGSISQELRDVSVGTRIFLSVEN